MSPQLQGIAPMVPVSDEVASAAFFQDVLGFDLRTHNAQARFALVARGDAGVILQGGADAQSLQATANNIAAYIWVKDIKTLWSDLAPKLDALPQDRVRPLFEQPYGMREFHVKDPDGFLIFFGEETETQGN